MILDETKEETHLEPGDRGELSVWVDGTKVAEKGVEPHVVVQRVQEALSAG